MEMQERMFTDFINCMSDADREEFYRTTVLNMTSPAAEAVKTEYYRKHLGHLGSNVQIGCNVTFSGMESISLGDNVRIADNCTLIARNGGTIEIGNGTRLLQGVFLDTESSGGYIRIGERVYIGVGCCFCGHKGLEIGDDSLLAQNITITPASHTFDDPDRTIYSQPCETRKIVIGRDCYLGMNVAIVCYAERIGDGAVIGAGSVVTREVPPGAIAVGCPAKVIRQRGGKPAGK